MAVADERSKQWDGRSRGGIVFFRLCTFLVPLVGTFGVRLGSYVIATGFMLAGGRFQYGSLQYFRRLAPRAGTLVLWMRAWRRYASFGRILCDRLLAQIDGQRFRFVYSDPELLRRTVTGNTGCILLAAHIGNWELSGYRLTRLASGMVNVVMVRGDEGPIQDMVDRAMRNDKVRVIDPRDPLGASLAIHAALQRGEVVCMLGDRVFGEQPWCEVDFLGTPARLPIGPFHAAAITGAPIVVCFLMKRGPREYYLDIAEPWYITAPGRGAERRQALQQAAQTWARRLEAQVRMYPMQWHNFYDYWQDAARPHRRAAGKAQGRR